MEPEISRIKMFRSDLGSSSAFVGAVCSIEKTRNKREKAENDLENRGEANTPSL